MITIKDQVFLQSLLMSAAMLKSAEDRILINTIVANAITMATEKYAKDPFVIHWKLEFVQAAIDYIKTITIVRDDASMPRLTAFLQEWFYKQ